MQEANGKMEFFFQYKEGDGSVAITLPVDASLEEVLEGFEIFLHAAGYVFNGEVVISDDIIDADLYNPKVEEN